MRWRRKQFVVTCVVVGGKRHENFDEKQTETAEESAGRNDPAEFLSGVDNLDPLFFLPAVAQIRYPLDGGKTSGKKTSGFSGGEKQTGSNKQKHTVDSKKHQTKDIVIISQN
jgi:hypothetical protein